MNNSIDQQIGSVCNFYEKLPNVSLEELLSVWAGACQPHGGVPRLTCASFHVDLQNKRTKTVGPPAI
jgi:hypothetical protein